MPTQEFELTTLINKPKTRRSALRTMLAAGLAGVGSRSALAQVVIPPGVALDAAVVNFALNLEYLEAEFYNLATTGAGLEAQGIPVTGLGQLGPVIVRPNPRITFADPIVEDFALELRFNETSHVRFLRESLTAAGSQPIARPALNLRESFTAAARAAGIVGPTETFDPFLNDLTFLQTVFMFEEVGVTAYAGASRLLTNKDIIESSARILATESYQSGVARAFLRRLGGEAITITQKISDLRDSLDSPEDKDQGLILDGRSNFVPTDANALVFPRTAREVLNIVYMAPNATQGGFFPNGVNGPLR